MDNFFVTLPSSSSKQIYPNNKIGEYTVQLSKEINLDGEWEVAIVDLFYPHAFINVNKWKNELLVRAEYAGKGRLLHTVRVPPGYYGNGVELADGINSAIEKTLPPGTDSLAFYYDKYSRTFSIFLDPNVSVYAEQGSQIGEYVGMIPFLVYEPFVDSRLFNKPKSDNTNSKNQDNLISKHIYKNRAYANRVEVSDEINIPTISTIWLYSDIVEYSNVGKIMSPLLNIANVKHGYRGKNIHETFLTPHYIPVAKRSFHSISIKLADSQGDAISFEFGEVTVMLHFRRRIV
jgi:hypothetical protein